MRIKIALAEDNPQLAKATKEILSSFDEVEVLFVASNGHELIQQLPTKIPDIILMDINMPVMDGIEAARRVHHLFPAIKIVMLTIFDDSEKIFEAILAGATGYLLKDEKPGKILSAIEDAVEGGAPMSASIAIKALQLIRGKKLDNSTVSTEFNLSAREMEILELVAKGEYYHQIADKLFISPKTVRKHVENIYSKLQVHNKVEAIQLATKHNLL
jgi:DNA-binding NarL/FixJ family response regulator